MLEVRTQPLLTLACEPELLDGGLAHSGQEVQAVHVVGSGAADGGGSTEAGADLWCGSTPITNCARTLRLLLAGRRMTTRRGSATSRWALTPP